MIPEHWNWEKRLWPEPPGELAVETAKRVEALLVERGVVPTRITVTDEYVCANVPCDPRFYADVECIAEPCEEDLSHILVSCFQRGREHPIYCWYVQPEDLEANIDAMLAALAAGRPEDAVPPEVKRVCDEDFARWNGQVAA